MSANQSIVDDLVTLRNSDKADILSRFFKTAKGQYGEGDIFLGITVPNLRRIARQYQDVSLTDIGELLDNEFHEVRLVALLILVRLSETAGKQGLKRIYDFYLRHTDRINNWDLVDLSAPQVVGRFLADRDKADLYRLANSEYLWERRIAIIATFWFIKNGYFDSTLRIADILRSDRHDLIHKAVGWMLREVGKRSLTTLLTYLDKNVKKLPRTTLRYAIEKLTEQKRKYYLTR